MSSTEVTTSAVAIWETLSSRCAALLGDAGIRTLLDRSLVVSSRTFPCFATVRASASAADRRWDALRDCLAREPPEQAAAAFAALFANTIELIARFIGEPLVRGVLHSAWPEIFLLSKETP